MEDCSSDYTALMLCVVLLLCLLNLADLQSNGTLPPYNSPLLYDWTLEKINGERAPPTDLTDQVAASSTGGKSQMGVHDGDQDAQLPSAEHDLSR